MSDKKIQQHYRELMSALMDGELEQDQSRFLMRRMGEDKTLNQAWERWQLCGEVLRGRAEAPAPRGFSERIAVAIAEESSPQVPERQVFQHGKTRWLRWGGAAAASVALAVVLMNWQQERQADMVAESAQQASPALAPQVDIAPTIFSGSASRNSGAPVVAQQDPFAGMSLVAPTARPWPRASQQLRGDDAYATGYRQGEQAPYYPFQPRIQMKEQASSLLRDRNTATQH